MPSSYNEEPPVPTIPVADEANPGLGRRSGLLEQQRRDSGGLDDSSPENPVRDDDPIKPAGGKRRAKSA